MASKGANISCTKRCIAYLLRYFSLPYLIYLESRYMSRQETGCSVVCIRFICLIVTDISASTVYLISLNALPY